VRLHDPLALLLLLVLPLLWWLRRGSRSASAVRYPSIGALAAGPAGWRTRWRWVPAALRVATLVLLVLAATRPQWGRSESRFTGLGIDIMLAVDISTSMLAEDFTLEGQRANRLEAAKSVVNDFVAGRAGDRIGLVLFAARPYTQAPLTLDHGWLQQNLQRAEIGMIEDGTAIGSALATATRRLESSDAKSKVIILLTDGQSNAGRISPETAADAARALGVKVYTIGAGTRGLAPYPGRDFFGNTVYQPVQVDIDEETLTRIAETTGGKYFRATDTASLQQIYDSIDQLERTEFEAPKFYDWRELYPWFLLPALLLLCLEVGLANTVLRRLP
jgi:Ca-activated chloride channel family protein